jgi:hypothetical protein
MPLEPSIEEDLLYKLITCLTHSKILDDNDYDQQVDRLSLLNSTSILSKKSYKLLRKIFKDLFENHLPININEKTLGKSTFNYNYQSSHNRKVKSTSHYDYEEEIHDHHDRRKYNNNYH